MKTTLLLLTSIVLLARGFAAPPTTPGPVPLTVNTPPQILTARAQISPAQLQANLNAVPAQPQSLLQLLATFAPLPSGVDASKVKSVTVLITQQGGATVTVQYVAP